MARQTPSEELNLVPFIGLFSTLTCFLVMTAVWNQLETLSTNVDNVTSSDSVAATENPNAKKETLTVTILKDRLDLNEVVTQSGRVLNERNYKINHSSGNIDQDKLKKVLEHWKTKYPSKQDVILNTDNQIVYNQMIQTFDMLVGSGFYDVGVNTQ